MKDYFEAKKCGGITYEDGFYHICSGFGLFYNKNPEKSVKGWTKITTGTCLTEIAADSITVNFENLAEG